MVPRRRSPVARNNPKEIREAPATRLLVVEDDADLSDVLCEMLTLSGYRVSYAIDGIAALETLRKKDLPDLILLDLMLPRMDGWEFRAAQLRDGRLKNIPVVVLSAVDETAKPIDADYLLRKPVDSNKLLAIIERFRH